MRGHRRRRATQRSPCNPHAAGPLRGSGSLRVPGGAGVSAALAFLDDDTTSPASRRLASAPVAPGTRPLLILGQAPGDRLRYAAERLSDRDTSYLKGKTRREKDLPGMREVPAHAYQGIQTLRAIENFPISGITLSAFHHFLNALAYVKKSCALANCDPGVLEKTRADAFAASGRTAKDAGAMSRTASAW